MNVYNLKYQDIEKLQKLNSEFEDTNDIEKYITELEKTNLLKSLYPKEKYTKLSEAIPISKNNKFKNTKKFVNELQEKLNQLLLEYPELKNDNDHSLYEVPQQPCPDLKTKHTYILVDRRTAIYFHVGKHKNDIKVLKKLLTGKSSLDSLIYNTSFKKVATTSSKKPIYQRKSEEPVAQFKTYSISEIVAEGIEKETGKKILNHSIKFIQLPRPGAGFKTLRNLCTKDYRVYYSSKYHKAKIFKTTGDPEDFQATEAFLNLYNKFKDLHPKTKEIRELVPGKYIDPSFIPVLETKDLKFFVQGKIAFVLPRTEFGERAIFNQK